MAANTESRDTAMFLYIGIVALMCYGFWHFFHQQVTDVFRTLCYWELWILSRIVDDPVVSQLRDILHDKRKYAVDWPYIRYTGHIIGHYIRYPIAAILGGLGYLLIMTLPKTSYKKTYSLDRLIAAQVKIWPVIAPIVKFNPAHSNSRDPNGELPENLPLFAEALSPEEWIKYNNISHNITGLDEEAATRCFAEQLGPRWRGPDALPFYAQGLFAAFALKAARQRDEADSLLSELALCADPKTNMTLRPSPTLRKEVQRIIKDPKLGGEAAKLARNHAYVATALLRLLRQARDRGGVLAPAQFLWLRGANRALWYPLNNLDRQSFHVEAAGAIAHYQAEMAADSQLLSPKVATAVASLAQYDQRVGKFMPVAAE